MKTNLLRKVIVPLAGVAVILLVLSITGPRAVRAALEMVRVVNTASRPIPNSDVNAPGDEPFQAATCLHGGTGSCPAATSGLSDGFSVPTATSDGRAVIRLVIEEVSWNCQETGGAELEFLGILPYLVANSANPNVSEIYLPITRPVSTHNAVVAGSARVTAYAEPGSGVGSQFEVYQPEGWGLSCSVFVIGRLQAGPPSAE